MLPPREAFIATISKFYILIYFLDRSILQNEVKMKLLLKNGTIINVFTDSLEKADILIENEKKLPQAMALIDACRYIVKIKYNDVSNLEKEMEAFMADEDWTTVKKVKEAKQN